MILPILTSRVSDVCHTDNSVWRCKCGVRIKVVSEIDENKLRATALASCPSCNELQMMNATRIIAISHETIETLPDAFEVQEEP
jgi:hypothetical protein